MSIIFENCDYIDLVKEMKEKNIMVHFLFTDPPYYVSRDYQLGFSNMGRAGMNYGKWDYGFDQRQWIKEVSCLVKKWVNYNF